MDSLIFSSIGRSRKNDSFVVTDLRSSFRKILLVWGSDREDQRDSDEAKTRDSDDFTITSARGRSRFLKLRND